MLDELIAFRVYGDFTWPTNPQGPTVRGYIEIFYKTLEPHPAAVAGPPGVPSLFACFRWVPQARAGDPMPVQLDRWVKQTDAQLTVQLGDATKIIQYRLDDDPAAPTPAAQWPQPRQFLGGAVFEEYAFTAVGYPAAQPFLQWPLTRRFSRGKGNRSGLQPAVILGHVSDKAGVDPTRRGASFGFQLALYTPGAQSTHDDSGGAGTKYPTYAFPFRVRYRPMLFNHSKNQPVEVGWFASGAAEDYQAESEIDFETEWHGQAVQLADKWLGGFGFCRSDGGIDNLYVPRKKTLRDRYWPSQGQSVSRDLIGKFAHVDPKLGDQIEVGNDIGPDGTFEVESQGELRNAIRFRRSDANSVITYRSSMRLKQGSDDLAGDIAIRGGQFELADPTIAGLRFPTDSDLVLIEVEIEYQITDIWAFVGDRTGIAADMRLRLGVGADVDDEPGNDRLGTDGPVNAPWSFKKRLANAVSGIRLSRLGLRGLEPLHAQSLLPEIEIDRAQNYRLALCATLTPRFTTLNTGQTGIVDYLNWSPETDGAVPLWPSFTLSGWPDKPTGARSGESPLGPAPNETGSLTATMQLPSFAYRSPGADDPSFAVAIVHDTRWENARRDCAFRIALSGAQQTALAGRLGGIEFATTADVLPKHDTDDSPDYSFWHFSVAPPIAIRRDGGQSYYANVDAELRLRLSLARLTSLGGDLPWGNRAPDSVPLLIPDDGAGENVPGGLILDATEMLGPQFDRRLVARIVDTGSGTGSAGTYVLLGEKPFSLKRVVSRPLQDRGSQENVYVAEYDSDTASWSFKLVTPTYHYVLPPQSVGESMDKPRRLEIHDPTTDPAVTFVRPYPVPSETPPQPVLSKEGAVQRHAVDFRLTPPAEMWIRPGDLDRGYFLPEWETQRLFGSYDAFGLGVELAAFRGEFLYGMPVGIDVTRETGAARGARVAEIGALMGKPPGPLPAAADEDRYQQWEKYRAMLERRPERLEFWMRDLSATLPFTPARFADGVRFTLRGTAVHAPPVDGIERQDLPGAAYSAPVRLLDHGLRGGAIWPLESANFARQLRQQPDARGGTIERIALAPDGGDANQRAEFLNGKVAIISETRNGFVQRHRVEIIGRIGVFWHRAKHVVVYERTTSPSEQFTPDSDDGIGTRTRRPVLRKVSEYIELLQPARNYPDFATAKSESVGFLRGVRFNSQIINVDSAWSEDVGDFGWRIPMWDRHAAVRRPHVYPRPDIAFVTAAEGDGDAPTVSQECLDPDNLWFFADVTPTATDDTDSWIPRINIDAANLPAPTAEYQSEVTAFGGSTGSRKPSAGRVPRGLRRFTWRLAPGAQRAVLNAERGAEPLFAGLDTLTFMRATGGDPGSLDANSPDGQRAVALARAMMTAQSRDLMSDPDVGIGAAVQAFVIADKAARPAQAQSLLARYDKWRSDFDQYAGRAAQGGAAAIAGTLNDLSVFAGDLPRRCEKMVDDFVGALQRRQLLILDKVRTWTASHALGDPNSACPDKATVSGNIVAALMKEIAPVLAEANADLGKLQSAVQRAKAVVDDCDTDLLARIADADRKLGEARQTYNDGKPWSAHRIDECQQRIAAVREGLAGDVARAIAEMQSRFATDVDGVAQSLTRQLNAKLVEIEVGEESILKAISQAEGAAAAVLADLRDTLREARANIAEMSRRVAAAIGNIADPNDVKRQALEALQARLASADKTFSDYDFLLEKAQVRLQTSTSGLADGIEAAGSALASFGNDVSAFITDAQTQLNVLDDNIADHIKQWLTDQIATLVQLPKTLVDKIVAFGAGPDAFFKRASNQIAKARDKAETFIVTCRTEIDIAAGTAQGALDTLASQVQPDFVESLLLKHVITPAVEEAMADLQAGEFYQAVYDRLEGFDALVATKLADIEKASSDDLAKFAGAASTACQALGTGLDSALGPVQEQLRAAADALQAEMQKVRNVLGDLDRLEDVAKGFADTVAQTSRELGAAAGAAHAYVDRVFETAGNVTSDGLASTPNNILRLYAAVASAPALPNLDFQRERLAYYYNELNKVIDTTAAEAWFGRLGDDLKAIGLSIPFSQIGDAIVPKGLDKLDIGQVFRNFAGIDLSKLFPGFQLPRGAGDAIRVSHAFDKQSYRAWVQIDVDLPLPERKSLFTVGPFSLDFVNSRLSGTVRLEASKDTGSVAQTGSALLVTDIDAVVSGESMVTLQRVGLHYDRASGLKVDFDPKKLKLNPAFQFIQDTLGALIPDEVGGVRVVKNNGIPVGIEHDFSMPPISLMYATSGVSNIAISNHFSLVAYPDFVIADRFALSSAERPFVFSIFVIGGTGYISIDCEYRPFGGGLAVVVDAAAGGSASLGFAAGPISGQVMISLSIVLSYHKSIDRPGGGLNMSLALLIAGGVDVAGIASVYLTVLLRMTYRDTGQVDGVGTVSVSVRISRFFTFSVRTGTNQKLRGGASSGSQAAALALVALAGGATPSIGERILGARG